MANSLQGVNLAAIAQKSLDTLLPRLPMITGVMATDFSSEVAVEGASITTRVATKTTAQDFNATTADQDATTTAKTITLSNYKGTRIAFTDSEWSKSSINLEDVFIKPAINGIASSILSSAFDILSDGNNLQCLEADFDAEKVAEIARQLTAADVPYEGRFLVLQPGYYMSLAKDSAVQAAYAYGSPDVIRENLIPRVHGFTVWESNMVPQNVYPLGGFAGHSQNALLATRLPAVPANFPGDVETVTDPESGFSLQFRRWYSADDRKHRMEVGVIYGVAAGTGGNVRIGNFE
jgi:hypothetical protein